MLGKLRASEVPLQLEHAFLVTSRLAKPFSVQLLQTIFLRSHARCPFITSRDHTSVLYSFTHTLHRWATVWASRLENFSTQLRHPVGARVSVGTLEMMFVHWPAVRRGVTVATCKHKHCAVQKQKLVAEAQVAITTAEQFEWQQLTLLCLRSETAQTPQCHHCYQCGHAIHRYFWISDK